MFLDKVDWLGLIVLGWFSLSIGLRCVRLAKSDKNLSAVYWGGSLWLPIYALQGFGAFLVWRMNGRNDVAVYETALFFFFTTQLLEIAVVSALHTGTKRKITAFISLINAFLNITCAAMFFNEHHWAAACYVTGLARVVIITARAANEAFSKSSAERPSPSAVIIASGPVVVSGSESEM